MRRLFLFLAPLALVACASEEEKVQNRIALEIEACKAATGEFYEVPYEVGDPYKMYRSFCDQPVMDVKLVDPVRATAKVGPYEFQLNKNLKEGRWGLSLVRWNALDSARNTLSVDNLTEADYKAAEEQLAKAEAEGPTVAEVKLKRLEVLIALRKKANKTQETMVDRASLGPVAEGYYKQATAAAREQGNPDLEAGLRLQVLNYLNHFRLQAEEASTPSEQAAEYELGSIKALENDAKEAKAKKDTAAYDKIQAEIELRKKEFEENQVKRQESAKRMSELSVELKKRQCAELQSARGVAPKEDRLSKDYGAALNAVGCP